MSPPDLKRKRQLKTAVRTGRDANGDTPDWDEILAIAKDLAEKCRTLPLTTEVLETLTICAEFQDLNRAIDNPLTILQYAVWPEDGNFSADFRRWFKMEIPSPETADQERARKKQMSWALMLLVWLHAYRSSDYKLALDLLGRIKLFIDTFATGDYPCLGTRARWHFLYGECCRASRRFVEAENSFLVSQTLLHDRLRDRLIRFAHEPLRMDSEIRFSAISTARILTFLGWSEVQTGRLARGRQLLASAATLVAGTGPDYTRLFVGTRRAIALRRMAAADYKDNLAFQAFTELHSMNAE